MARKDKKRGMPIQRKGADDRTPPYPESTSAKIPVKWPKTDAFRDRQAAGRVPPTRLYSFPLTTNSYEGTPNTPETEHEQLPAPFKDLKSRLGRRFRGFTTVRDRAKR